ncbi:MULTISPECIES: hypothetical protein [unclassified Imperialibacter]|uniref:hypothetical protein n=1 Tax=unclassified Imperialibacter TaxID=2629706 RepID=UPI001257C317|nr:MULTISPECIES: hypothetical protein [unclassified Imperialibacter]CAD5262707.1 conserved exported hypothetical protein [Imperialibacter sp. 75]CAD5275886.1 conserved exported hypothetical protein [Imperialibacter sp. 89]VVT08536.1 exported hypothetical protein [Imperialibacter sp. EC-SDR9]
MKTSSKSGWKWLALLSSFASAPLLTFGQDQPVEMRNGLVLTAGIPSLSISYERQLAHKKENRRFYLRGIAGQFGDLINQEWTGYLAVMPAWVFGNGNNHLETGVGLTLVSPSNSPEVWAALNLGYRYQKPGEALIFRAGGGIPEGAYISLGLAF